MQPVESHSDEHMLGNNKYKFVANKPFMQINVLLQSDM